MQTQPQDKHDKAREELEHQQLSALISKHVMLTLGRPGDLCRVQVRRLWQDHYRVNVFVGADIASAKVAHSYFLVADADGNIINSAPDISKLY
jgi:hypothetical protein